LARQDCASDHLDTVETALDRMSGIIDDTLALVKAGKQIERTDRLALSDVVRRSWRNVATEEAEIAVESGTTLVADEGRIRHLFENLFRNAVEHGDGDVTLRVGALEDGFYVEDDGPGIPDSEREDVFEAGYSGTDGGTGFGLSIVARVAESHGWDVAATAGSAGGARFEITGVDSAAGYGDR
jgi:signal transduction histidine kinase